MEPRLLFLRLPHQEIVMFKFILESYEELGIVRTIDPLKGELCIISTESLRKDLDQLMLNLIEEFRIFVHQENILSEAEILKFVTD